MTWLYEIHAVTRLDYDRVISRLVMQWADSGSKASRAHLNVLGPKPLDAFMALAGSACASSRNGMRGLLAQAEQPATGPEVAACYNHGASELDE
mmetsp:Transcript_31117/g.55161  ORF Transcript_31117/g.55161 Transcript_31117/m.55161 type:complete len:94 (+) Transcript_31117:128-409(+)